MQMVDGGQQAPVYHPISKVQCISYLKPGPRLKNVDWAIKQEMPRLMGTLAIVAGGPTLNNTFEEAKKFPFVMTCGSAHDHAIKLGIRPTYHIDCDPAKTQWKQYRQNIPGTIYLIASRCDKSLFKYLRNGRDVRLWHMWEEDLGKPVFRGEIAYICGATVVLSAIPIAMALGFNDFHFFGFDSSFENEKEHHAYPQPEFSKIMTAKIGDPINGREYKTTATWLGQAQQFEEMQNKMGNMFRSTFYGDSMMSAMQKERERQLALLNGVQNESKS